MFPKGRNMKMYCAVSEMSAYPIITFSSTIGVIAIGNRRYAIPKTTSKVAQ
jgi:hypothetical protein